MELTPKEEHAQAVEKVNALLKELGYTIQVTQVPHLVKIRTPKVAEEPKVEVTKE